MEKTPTEGRLDDATIAAVDDLRNQLADSLRDVVEHFGPGGSAVVMAACFAAGIVALEKLGVDKTVELLQAVISTLVKVERDVTGRTLQ